MAKPFVTIQEQLNLLKDRGLIVKNDDEAMFILSQLNYYRLSGYSLTLRKNDIFYPNVTFDDIMQIYNFDKELKNFILLLLEDLEISLRTHLGYILGGIDPLAYLNEHNFASGVHYNDFNCEIAPALKDNRNEAFIKHHQTKYGNELPVWVFVETLSFGTLSRLFSSLHIDIQKTICSGYYKNIPNKYIINWFESLVILRNLCAHHSRLFNRGLPNAFSFSQNDFRYLLEQGYDRNQIGKRVFFSLLIASRLSPDSKTTDTLMINKIQELHGKYPFVNLKHYGFKPDWEHVLSDFNLNYKN